MKPVVGQKTLLASEARTATTASSDQQNTEHNGVTVIIDVSAVAATPSVVFTIQGKNELTGTYYDLLSSAAVTATGVTRLRVHPALTVAANAAASDLLPSIWRVNAVHGDADSITYSVQAILHP
jgi:hypothetical protein